MDFENPNRYRILAYFDGATKRPQTFANTGCFQNAEKTAKDIATEGFLAKVINTETGDFYEYKPAPVAAKV